LVGRQLPSSAITSFVSNVAIQSVGGLNILTIVSDDCLSALALSSASVVNYANSDATVRSVTYSVFISDRNMFKIQAVDVVSAHGD
jgi:hypothetical protein